MAGDNGFDVHEEINGPCQPIFTGVVGLIGEAQLGEGIRAHTHGGPSRD
jgi:hypothetical protein